MGNPVYDPEKALGYRITNMDKQELCEFVSKLCRTVISEVGARGRRGGIYPENISVDDNGNIAVGAAHKDLWEAQELEFIAPEQYWSGSVSAACDVYSVGMLMYYALNGGKLPFEGSIENPQMKRMDGGDIPAPKKAGERLGKVIEKCLRFRASERYQTLDELRAVLDSIIKDTYSDEMPSAEAIFRKDTNELDEIEQMMLGIIDKKEAAPEPDQPEEEPETVQEPEPPESGVKVYTPAPKQNKKQVITSEQVDMLAARFMSQGSPAAPQMRRSPKRELEPIVVEQAKVRPAVRYSRAAERERVIADEVKKRRRRPLAIILVLCAVLVMVAIILNAILKDYQQVKDVPDNSIEAITVDPYSETMPPVETPEDTLGIDTSGFFTVGVDETKVEPVIDDIFEEEVILEHSYQVFKEDISWTQAQQKCFSMGGHLVVINDEEEFDKVVALAEGMGVTRAWIGCHRINGVDTWEKGTEGYIKWAKGEPTYVDTNDKVAEDYIMLWNNNGWACNDNRDDPCADYPEFYSGTMGYICEFGD